MCYNTDMRARDIFIKGLKGTGQVVGAVGMIAIGLIKALAFTATGMAMDAPSSGTPIHAMAAASAAATAAAKDSGKTEPATHGQTAQELGQAEQAEGPRLLGALMDGVALSKDMEALSGETDFI